MSPLNPKKWQSSTQSEMWFLNVGLVANRGNRVVADDQLMDTADHLMAHPGSMFRCEDFQEGVKVYLERRKTALSGSYKAALSGSYKAALSGSYKTPLSGSYKSSPAA